MKKTRLYSTRVSQHPSWMVSGLQKTAMAAKDEPDQTIYRSDLSYNSIKTTVIDMLNRSGIQLSPGEIRMGSYWLANRIALLIGKTDTPDVAQKRLDDQVHIYIADKAAGRATGKYDRSQVTSLEDYDRVYPPSIEPDDDMGKKAAAEEGKPVYVALDGDDIGHLVEDTLLLDDPAKAQEISQMIHSAHEGIRHLLQSRGGTLIFDGGDNMLLFMNYDPKAMEEIRDIYKTQTGHTATVGVGERPIEAHYSLVVGKNRGKDKVVVYDPSVADQYQEIKEEQARLRPVLEKLKYQANDKGLNFDLGISDKLKGALKELQMDSDGEGAYDFFLRIIEKSGLHDVETIRQFFDQDRETLKQSIREVYAKRLDWSIKLATRELSEFEVQTLLSDLTRYADSADCIRNSFGNLVQLLCDRDPSIVAMAAHFDLVSQRTGLGAIALSEGLEKNLLTHSDYLKDVNTAVVEIASMVAPVDQAVITAIKAVANAEEMNRVDDPEFIIDVNPVIEIMTKLIEKMNVLAMSIEMAGVVSMSDPKMVVRASDPSSAPQHFPGGSNVPSGKGQKSPHKRHDWWSAEDYNEGKVDYNKTDLQYVTTNVSKDSEMMGGGDPGPAIYIP